MLFFLVFGLLASEAFSAKFVDLKERTPYLRRSVRGVNSPSLKDALSLSGSTDLKQKDVLTTAQGVKVEKFQEMFQDIPVFNTLVDIEEYNDGESHILTGDIYEDLEEDLEGQMDCTLQKYEAIDIALRHANMSNAAIEESQFSQIIYVLDNDTAIFSSVLRLSVECEEDKSNHQLLTFIGMCDGDVLKQYDQTENHRVVRRQTGDTTEDQGMGDTTTYGGMDDTTTYGGILGDTTTYGGMDDTTTYGRMDDTTTYGGMGDTTTYGGMGDTTTYYGGNGDTTTYGGMGDTTTYGGMGDTTTYGGMGDTTTYYGGNGDTTTYGGMGDTTTYGGMGDTTTYGGMGDTTTYGGMGDTTTYGGMGDTTTYYGGMGDTTTNGGMGDTTTYGGMGDTTTYGGMGDTTTYGGMGDTTTYYGGNGDTTTYGGMGDTTTYYGGNGDTTTYGGMGDTTTYGGMGDTTTNGGNGDTTTYGGMGDTTTEEAADSITAKPSLECDVKYKAGNPKKLFLLGTKPHCLELKRVGDTCYLENGLLSGVDMKSQWKKGRYKVVSFECSEGYDDATNGGLAPMFEAFYFATQTIKTYVDLYNHIPVKEHMYVRAHYEKNYANAFYDGSSVSFGDGDGVSSYPWTNLDTVGHEYGHAVVSHGSGLVYGGQSGAMNEAYSDMLGEVVEEYVFGSSDMRSGWEIHVDDISLRYFDDPTKDGHSIKNVKDYYDDMSVHSAAGVYNLVFYKMYKAFGSPRYAFESFVIANRMYWKPEATFESAACGTIQGAYDAGLDMDVVAESFKAAGHTLSRCDDLAKFVTAELKPNVKQTGLRISKIYHPLFKVDVRNLKGNHINAVTTAGYSIAVTKSYRRGEDNVIAQGDGAVKADVPSGVDTVYIRVFGPEGKDVFSNGEISFTVESFP